MGRGGTSVYAQQTMMTTVHLITDVSSESEKKLQ